MSDHELIVRYKTALEVIAALYIETPATPSALFHVAKTALKGDK